MKISVYSKIGAIFFLIGCLLFLTAVSLFSYRSNDPIAPFLKNVGEFALIAWIPFSLVGAFIIGFRMINKTINDKHKNP